MVNVSPWRQGVKAAGSSGKTAKSSNGKAPPDAEAASLYPKAEKIGTLTLEASPPKNGAA